VVKLLIEMGKVDVDVRDDGDQTALNWAAEKGEEEVVRLLLETGRVDINAREVSGRTPLHWAAWKGHEGVTNMLLENREVDVNARDKDDRTPLSWAAENGHGVAVSSFVIKNPQIHVEVSLKERKTAETKKVVNVLTRKV
jgi:ankyrin repeat protein